MSLEKLRTARCIAGVHQVCKAVQSGAAEAVFMIACLLRCLRRVRRRASSQTVRRHGQSWANMPALT